MVYRTLSDSEYRSVGERILFEDNHLLVINKLPGEITQGDRTGDECLAETLKAFVAQRDSKPGHVFMGVPHRLDRPCSGICVFAKTDKALGRMSALFRDGAVRKIYWALCCGRPEADEGSLENWLGRNEKQNKAYVVDGKKGEAKLARLNYRYLRSTDRYHLVEVELLTGRHHQIRCQLSHIGCPIKGDLKYGAPRSNPDGGICLHSREASFVHPVTKRPLTVTAPLPPGWKGFGL
ncbi:MAG: RluA family pseudouridine synthase [Bacteroidales bacterium]|nr:RluA family pseudouridine synthase [Bacteroidales bacterium]